MDAKAELKFCGETEPGEVGHDGDDRDDGQGSKLSQGKGITG